MGTVTEWNVSMTDEAQRSDLAVSCDGCGQTHYKGTIGTQGGEWTTPPENGWYLPYKHFGYYNGFDDRAFEENTDELWWLCHDCVVKFLEAFPMLADKLGIGGHYNLNHTGDEEDGTVHEPCCRWAWTSRPCEGKAFEAFIVGSDGKWKSHN